MTGGTGADALSRFYAEHFIPKMPKDTTLTRFRAPWAPTGWWTR